MKLKKTLKACTVALLLTSLSISTNSCRKESPSACVTVTTNNVMVGETFLAINCSTGADHYIWDDGDGTITNVNSQASRSIMYNDIGTYVLQLTAISSNGKHQSIATTVMNVGPAYGSITFWQSGTPVHYVTTVNVNGIEKDITLFYPSGINDCNTSGCANYDLPIGDYTFTASDSKSSWSGGFTITTRGCLKYQLL